MKTGELRVCSVCNNEFYISLSQAKIRVGKYCSYKCMNIARRTGTMKKCLKCSKDFYVKRNISLREKEGKYCSLNCYRQDKHVRIIHQCKYCHLSFKENKRVERIFCSKTCKDKYWTQGNTPEEKLERIRFHQTIRKQVLKRDNFTCSICHQRGGNLQVDHIKPWKECVEQRFKIDNCRTLCMGCHYKITFNRPMPEYVRNWGHSVNA